MLSTDLVLICAVTVALLSLCLALLCWLNARRARIQAAHCYEYVQQVQAARDPTARLAEISAELTELTDAYAAMLKSHKKLRSRITMRENREKAGTTGGGDLASIADKQALRLAAKARGLLK